MITDALVNFIPVGSTLAITNVAVATNAYDILGSGVGTAPANIIGNRSTFGADLGVGGLRPQLEVPVVVAFVGGTSLNVAFQGAPDPGSASNYTPAAGDWKTLVETGAILTASLTAQQVLARFDWPPAFPPGLNARFLRLLFTPVGTFTAGTVGAIVTMVRDDQANKFATKNFTVA
jgi:hypothetical protein